MAAAHLPGIPIRYSPRVAGFALLVLVLVLYSPVLAAPFVSDDYWALLHCYQPDWRQFIRYWAIPLGFRYRPLTCLTFSLDSWLWGLQPFGYHLTNILLHWLNGLLVMSLLSRYLASQARGFLAALLFVAHPLQVPAVAWVAARVDLLCTDFVLLSLFLLHRRSEPTFIDSRLALLAFCAGLLSKETAITLPFLLVVLLRHGPGAHGSWSQIWYEVRPFFFVLAVYLALRLSVLRGDYATSPFLPSGLGAVAVHYCQFFWLLLWPFALLEMRDWYMTNASGFLQAVAIPFLCLVCLLGLFRRQVPWRQVALGFAWTAITLVPTMGMVFRWYLYLPSIGWVWWLAALPRPLSVLALSAFLAYLPGSWLQAGDWREAGRLTRQFLSDIRGMYPLPPQQELTLLNLPRGYRTAYMLSAEALPVALQVSYRQPVRLRVLSEIHLAGPEDVPVSIRRADNSAFILTTTPSAEHYFVIPVTATLAGTYLDTGTTLEVPDWDATATVLATDEARRTVSLRIRAHRDHPIGQHVWMYDAGRLRPVHEKD